MGTRRTRNPAAIGTHASPPETGELNGQVDPADFLREAEEHFASLDPASQIQELRKEIRDLWEFSHRQDYDIRKVEIEVGLP